MAFALPQANLLGTLFEALIYGAYVVVYIEHMRILYRKKSRSGSYIYFQATSILLFVMITIHLVVDIIRAMDAYTAHMATPNAPILFFEQFNTIISRLRTGVYNAITLISDLFLVYRCFVVWGNSYAVALLPFLLFLVDIGMAIWVTDSLNRAKAGDPFAATLVGLRSKYLFIVTLAENLLCTILIGYKIWSIQREVAAYNVQKTSQQRSLSRVIVIITESAAIYSVVLIALIWTDAVGSPAFFTLLDLVSPVIGMVFSAIIVRSGSNKPTTTQVNNSTMKFEPRLGTAGSTTIARSTRLDKESGVHIELDTVRQTTSSIHSHTLDHDSDKQAMEV